MKEKKAKVYADLIDSPERLEALIQDRRKRRKVIQICFGVIVAGTLLSIIGSIGTRDSSATSLAIMAVFFGVYICFEFEWQLLHILRRMADEKGTSEPTAPDNPDENTKNPE